LVGDREIVGEKTPDHLRWWGPLTRALPTLRVVAVSRDPRSVVASNMNLQENAVAALVADRWLRDQYEIDRAAHVLGPQRLLRVGYEAVVSDPDQARADLAEFLGVSGGGIESGSRPMFLPWEGDWKAASTGPVTTERVQAWRNLLSHDEVRQVEVICGKRMSRLDYRPTVQVRSPASARFGLVPMSVEIRLARARFSRVRQRFRIERLRLESGHR
jgi:hypothetical protein